MEEEIILGREGRLKEQALWSLTALSIYMV